MSNLLKFFTVLFISLSLLIPNSYAGEPMKAGEVLKEDSYVFSLEEAQGLKIKIEELEQQIKKQGKIINNLEKLDLIHKTKEEEFGKVLESKNEQISLYRDLNETSSARVEKLEHRRTVRDTAIVTTSILTTIALILIADTVDDHIDKTGPTTNKMAVRVRF